MSATMDQLQKLTNIQLCIMCHNYHIAPRYIEHLSRRQLERRLHVAIIGERAKLRAYDLLHGIEYEPNQMRSDLKEWRGNDGVYDGRTMSVASMERARMAVSSWPRHEVQVPPFKRFRGGFVQKEELERLAQNEEDCDTESIAPPHYSEPETCFAIESEQMELNYERQQRVHQVGNISIEQIESGRIENYHEWNTPQEPDTDYHSFSSEGDNRSSISKPYSKCAINQLHKAERLTWLTASSLSLVQQSEPDPDLSSERELCTINYLSEEQLTAVKYKNDDGQLMQLMNPMNLPEICEISDSINMGDDTLSYARLRPFFWRYLLELICCNPQGKLDVNKLRNTFLCCALVICTYVGVKMLQ